MADLTKKIEKLYKDYAKKGFSFVDFKDRITALEKKVDKLTTILTKLNKPGTKPIRGNKR
jgi:hypothetical protein